MHIFLQQNKEKEKKPNVNKKEKQNKANCGKKLQ